MTTNRRRFLQRSLVGAAAAAVPMPLRAASDDPIARWVADLRGQQEMHRRAFIAGMMDGDALSDHPSLQDIVDDLGNGLGGIAIAKALETLPVEDQVHPSVQALLLDVAGAIGAAVVRSGSLLSGYLASDDPARELGLLESIRSVSDGLDDWRTTPDHRARLRRTLGAVLDDTAPGRLERRIRRQHRQSKRLERLSQSIWAQWEDTGVMTRTDPILARRVRAGRRKWAVPQSSRSAPRPRDWLIVLGLLVIGAGLAIGGSIVILGICSLSCGDGAALLLVGIGVCGVAIGAGVKLIQTGSAWYPLRVRGGGWLQTPVVRTPGQRLRIRSRDAVLLPDAMSPEPLALYPNIPAGALLGRLGIDVFQIVYRGEIPPGPEATLFLRLNLKEDLTRGMRVKVRTVDVV
ncbi:MAG: hypothetical protein AAFV53_04570 [Myxococcota bacterium]